MKFEAAFRLAMSLSICKGYANAAKGRRSAPYPATPVGPLPCSIEASKAAVRDGSNTSTPVVGVGRSV